MANPDLQIRRGGGAGHPDPEIGEGGTQFGLQIRGGGLPLYEIEETSKWNDLPISITKSASLFSFRRKNIIGNFTTIPTLLTHYTLTNRWILLLFYKYYRQLKVEGFTFICLVVFKGPFSTFLWKYDVTIIILMWQNDKIIGQMDMWACNVFIHTAKKQINTFLQNVQCYKFCTWRTRATLH